MEMRLKMIANGFSVPFILMSLSYEPLFLLAFFINLLNWAEVEMLLINRILKNLKELIFYEPKLERKRDICFDDLRIGLIFVSIVAVVEIFWTIFLLLNVCSISDALRDDWNVFYRKFGEF